jgi:glucose/arabinose dehydrogenase
MARRPLLVLSAFVFVATAPPQLAAQPSFQEVAGGLAFPTNMAFALDGRIFFTEKETGDVRIIRDGRVLLEPFVHVFVEGGAERGLLGIALHPDFEREPWVYLYYSVRGGASNQIIRVRAEAGEALEVDPIITLLPAVTGYRNGGTWRSGRTASCTP